MNSSLRLAAIVARAANGCIGRDNKLPWHLPNDLKYFKRVTLGKPIIMGRKTWESLKGPLPGRANIVISRDPDYHAEGARTVQDLEQAIALASDIALIDGVDEAVIIGGAEIYRLALERIDRLYVTEVHAVVEGDTFFPELDGLRWQEAGREDFSAEGPNPYDYSFVVYQRREG